MTISQSFSSKEQANTPESNQYFFAKGLAALLAICIRTARTTIIKTERQNRLIGKTLREK
jgi:hypothetical protein